MVKIFTRIDGDTTRQTIKIYKEEVKADKKRFVLIALLVPTAHFIRYVLTPLLMSFILQSLITKPHDIETPLKLLGIMAVAALIAIFGNNRGFTWLFNHEERVSTRLYGRAMQQLMDHGYEFFASHKVGALAGDVTGFGKSYQGVMDALWLQASPIVINYLTSLLIIAFMAPYLVLPLALLTFGVVALSIRSLNLRSVYRNERKRLISQLAGLIADVLGNQILVKVFARERHEVKKVVRSRTVIEDIARKEIDVIERESIFRQLLLFTFQAISLLIGIWLYGQGNITIAALVFIITYLGRIADSMYSITTIIRTVEQAFLDAAPITKILNQPIDVLDAQNAARLNVNDGRISFENVSFAYQEAAENIVFSKLSLTIPAKQRIGLAGYSGGGKTTLTKLLLRFVDISGGVIQIDGQNIAKVTQESLRHAIAYVPQEPFLFHRTLRENISYGNPTATESEILLAAQKAHAMEFIEKLPNGLDTVVGERGVKLSGGQRQRVAIARAILKNAPILVLDEATSALDSESERLIQASIAELMKDKTAIVIAHRLSTIAKLDRIIVIDEGHITEDGSHDELLAKNGVYAKLWAHQSGGFIGLPTQKAEQ